MKRISAPAPVATNFMMLFMFTKTTSDTAPTAENRFIKESPTIKMMKMTNKEIPYTINEINKHLDFMDKKKNVYEELLKDAKTERKDNVERWLNDIKRDIKTYEEWKEKLENL